MRLVESDSRKQFRYSAASGAQIYDADGYVRAAKADTTIIQRGVTFSYPVVYCDDGESIADLSTGWTATWSLRYGPSYETALLEVSAACSDTPPNVLVEVNAASTASIPAGYAWQSLEIASDAGEVIRLLEGLARVVD